MNNLIEINLINTKDFHRDLNLVIPSINLEVIADSYYLLLDNLIKTDSEGYDKVLNVLISILSQWKIKIEKLEVGDKCFLPFDFSDQYIGCLRIEQVDTENISGMYGVTQNIMTIGINPSDVNEFILAESDFRSRPKKFSFLKYDLLSSINLSIVEIPQRFYGLGR